jgi:hypothetical protein
MKVNDTMAKQVNKFTYLDTVTNSGRRTDGKIKRIQNNFKCYRIIKWIYGTEMSQTNAKQQSMTYILK